jgi:hypothetical protein
MIFTFNEYLDYKYKIKNNLDIIPKNSKKFKEYKKKLRGTEPDVIKMKAKLIKSFADNINTNFITNLCSDKSNKLIFHSMNHILHKNEITTIIIYRKIHSNINKIKYIVLLIAVLPILRKCGYGTISLNEFINYIYKKKHIEIILHSLKSSLHFYLNYGFTQIEKNKFLENYESHTENEEFIILKYTKI